MFDEQLAQRHDGVQRIDLLIQLGRLVEADEAASEQVAHAPDDPRPWVQLSNVRRRRGQLEDAVDASRRAVGLAPELPQALLALANALLAQGELIDAREVAHQLVEVDPHSWIAHYTLADVLRRSLATRGFALLAARQAVALNPHNPQAHNLLGICQQSMGQVDDALESYQAGLAVDPHNADLLNNLGALRLRDKRVSDASQSLVAGLLVDAQHQQLANNLTRLLIVVMARLALVCCIAVWVISLLDIGTFRSHWPGSLRVRAGAALAVGCAWYLNRSVTGLPRRSRLRVIVSAIRQDTPLLMVTALAVLLVGFCELLAFGPAHAMAKLFLATMKPPGEQFWLFVTLGTIAYSTRLMRRR